MEYWTKDKDQKVINNKNIETQYYYFQEYNNFQTSGLLPVLQRNILLP
jgi:hypothetical protein